MAEVKTWVALIVMLALGIPGTARAEFSCSDVLKWGLFNEESLHSSREVGAAFHSWQCTNTVSTHDDLKKMGFGLEAIVDGVPLDAKGNVDNTLRDSWRQANCSKEDRAGSEKASLDTMKRKVAVPILTAWNACVRDVVLQASNRGNGLVCLVEKGDSNYVQLALSRLSTGNNVIGIKGVNIKGVKGPSELYKLKQFPVPMTRFFLTRADAVGGKLSEVNIVINTDAGTCNALFPELVELHQGTIVLTTSEIAEDQIIRADKMVIPNNTKIMIHGGVRVRLEAHEIDFGSNVLVDGTGDPGAPGRPVPDSTDVRDLTGQYNPGDACQREVDANATAQLGRPGEQGGNGGRGATIEIIAPKLTGDLKTLQVINVGGAKGKGSRGGLGPLMFCHRPDGNHEITWKARLGVVVDGGDGNAGMPGPSPVVGGSLQTHFVEPPSN